MALEGGMSKSLHFTENKNLIMKEINYKNKEILYKRELLKKYVSTENYSTNEILRIKNNINKLPPNIQIPKGNFSKQIALALKLINSDQTPTFIHLEQEGFDTHQNQVIKQNKKLKELGANIYALKRGAEKLNKDIDLNIIVTSEFGRRLKENSTRGTDHGNASIALLIGDSFDQKFLGSYPTLDNLDFRGDLIPNISPKFLYEYAKRKIWF